MKITRVVAKEFMSHEALDVQLPDTGVVLVTGPNGAGKSAIMEAVAYAFWGKTLRGSDPRRDDVLGLVASESDRFSVLRSWKSGGSSRLEVVGEQHENSTKAQDRVSSVLSWDVWRRSCAFSSADAAHFTLAADADRKRLLEAILGLDRLDAAHEAARKDLRMAEQVSAASRLASTRILGALDGARREVAKRSAMPAQPKSTLEQAQARADVAEQDSQAKTRAIEKMRSDAAEAQVESRVASAAVASAGKVVEKLRESSCPTCERPFEVDSTHLQEAQREHAATITALDRARSRLETITKRGSAAMSAVRPVLEEAKKASSYLTFVQQEWFSYNQAASLLAEANSTLGELELDLLDAESTQFVNDKQVALLEACCQVLGTRGVRSQVLAAALGDLESSANRWLHEIGDRDLKVTIRPQVERASGSIADVVTMEVQGAGGGRGYKGASAGERRRIDVALMLGLAEMAGRAHGTSGSTLFFDEVFDALDAAGARAVAQALGKLAQTRAVVCISHSQALAAELAPVLHIRVNAGVANVCSR